jgi:regulator of sigma E protease
MLPSLIIFLIVLSILVFIHEIGHFLAAKRAGIKVEEFGFGYPPRIWGKKIGETVYSVNWIPFGGFVRILGQEAREARKLSAKDKKKAFYYKPKKDKALVLLAGVLGNFLLGVVCFTLVYSKIGIPKDLGYIRIVGVEPGSPAQLAGLKPEDRLLAINGKETEEIGQFMQAAEENAGKEVVVSTQRGEFTILVRENPPENEGRIGVVITDFEKIYYPWWQMPFFGAWEGLKEAIMWGGMVVYGIVLTIQQLFMGITPQVAGPVGIYQLTATVAQEGMLPLIQFVGFFSINLAVINLLPFPALDGGHLIFLFLGDILSEKKRNKVEHVLNMAGFALLITLMILITINDVLKIIKDTAFFKQIYNFLPF